MNAAENRTEKREKKTDFSGGKEKIMNFCWIADFTKWKRECIIIKSVRRRITDAAILNAGHPFCPMGILYGKTIWN